ncbi:unnamed protein product [Lampetra planeri]
MYFKAKVLLTSLQRQADAAGKKPGSGILDHMEVGDEVFGEAVEEITAIVELRSYEATPNGTLMSSAGQENTSYASVVAAEGSQIVLSCGVADDSERRRVQRIDRAMAHSGVCTQPGTVAMKTYRMSDG